MSADYLPPFATEGTLEDKPLPLLIAQILDEKLTGMLHIESEGIRYWIYFDEGFPAGVGHPKSQDFLGSVLQELSFIDSAAFNTSLMKMAQTKQLQGQVLIEMGAIDEAQLERGLSLQVARKLARLFSIKTGLFTIVEDEEMPITVDPIRVNSYALIYNAIRNNYDAEDLKKGLAGVIGKSVRVSRLFVERGALFEFPADDLATAKLLEEFRLPQDYVRACRSGPTAAMMMLLALLYCNMLEFEEAEFAQPMPGTQAAPRPAAPRTPAAAAAARANAPGRAAKAPDADTAVSAELRTKIDDKFEQIKTAQPWEVLEVEKEADRDRLKKAFYTLAKVYHPDRVVNSGDEELNHRIDVVISKINESYQILTDPHARMAYMAKKGQQESAGPAGKPQHRPAEAKIQFQKAMVYYKKRDLLKAAESLRWATDMNSEVGDYLAWRHWVDYERSDEAEDIKVDKIKGDLLALSKSQPECYFAARFLAKIYQQLNDNPNYEKFLTKANKLNPKDVEVSRELRLYWARREKADQKGKFLGIRFRKTDE